MPSCLCSHSLSRIFNGMPLKPVMRPTMSTTRSRRRFGRFTGEWERFERLRHFPVGSSPSCAGNAGGWRGKFLAVRWT